jgi:hypothetical protein
MCPRHRRTARDDIDTEKTRWKDGVIGADPGTQHLVRTPGCGECALKSARQILDPFV